MSNHLPPPCVSVIVPMYKVERYIEDCIDSILNQTFQDFEIIIVDDASPDNCYDICQKLYGNNEKVRIIRHKKNKGLGSSRNTGMKNARGEYIYFVDSDDLILPNALEVLYNAAKESDAEVIHPSVHYRTYQEGLKIITEKNVHAIYDVENQSGFLSNDVFYRLREYWQKYKVQHTAWLYMVKKRFIEKSNIQFLEVISEDELFSFDLFLNAPKIYSVSSPIYIYRMRKGSIMGTLDIKRFTRGLDLLLKGSEHIVKSLNANSQITHDKAFQNEVILNFFHLVNANHIKPFYNGQYVDIEIDKVIYDEFSKTFKEYTFLVKYLLNMMNTAQKSYENLKQKLESNTKQIQQKNQMDSIYQEKESMLRLIKNLKTNEKKFIFMLTPTHGNLGDQAIVLAEYFIMQSCFPDHKIIEIPYDYMVGELGRIFAGLGYQKYIRPQNDIVLHGGGNLGNIWINEEIARRAVIEKFPNNRIVSFPQSIHFTDDAEGQKQAAISSKIYNAHKDLYLMLRDENSFNVANELFPNIKTYLLPDIVTSLFGQFDKSNVKRDGILFVLRKDKEKVRNDKIIERIQDNLKKNNIPFSVIDNVISEKITSQNRRVKVFELMMQFRKSKVVITDRFHGVIFSVITRTPVAAFKSYDTKISSGIKWFKDFPSVYYAENNNVKEILKFIEKAYNGKFNDSLNTPSPFGVATERLCKEIFHG